MALDGVLGVTTILGVRVLLGSAIGLACSGLSLLPSADLALGLLSPCTRLESLGWGLCHRRGRRRGRFLWP